VCRPFYPSLTIMTALKEANQVGYLQPTTLVSYDADLEHVFDCRDHTAGRAQGMDAAALADPTLRYQMKSAGETRKQTFGRRLAADGYCGLIVKSYAPAATADDLNLVLWNWSNASASRLILIGDEHRLSL
jgi:RES domain-containing protein